MLLLPCVIVLLALYLLYRRYWLYKQYWHNINSIIGEKPLPLIGNVLTLGWKNVEIRKNIFRIWNKFDRKIFKIMIGSKPIVIISTPSEAECLLTSQTQIKKGDLYRYLKTWLGDGLILSTGRKWFKRRRIITPAFHFKILDQSIDVFHRSCGKLIDNLAAMSDTDRWTEIDVHPLISKASLDSICESAMGVNINAQTTECYYEGAVNEACRIIHRRTFSILKSPDYIFNLTPDGRRYKQCLQVMHNQIDKIVRARRSELSREIELVKSGKPLDLNSEDYNGGGKCKRLLAFLDLLLLSKDTDGMMLDDEFITEEVNTFMFAGHDTTASALSFTIYELSKSKYIQDKLLEEQVNIFGVDYNDVPVDKRSLSELRLLDRVIKETLRIHPSVPMIGRTLIEDIQFPDGTKLSSGSTVFILPMLMHMNPDIYPQPDKFDPDRFLPEKINRMNPFAYVPFSAGPRNCIGQKYAMLEMKTFLTLLIREFEFISNGFVPEIVADVTLKSFNGIRVMARQRQRHQFVQSE